MYGLLNWLDGRSIWQVGVLLFAMFWVAALLGRALASKHPREDKGSDPGLIVSSSLGLMALLLGFTVSMAVARYDERRAAMVEEANAIGTFLYRLDLLPAEARSRTLDALEGYVAARVRVGQKGELAAGLAEARAQQAVAQERIWREVVSSVLVAPDGSFRILIVPAANQMFDMATARDVALENRLPVTLLLLLLFFPFASLMLIGYVSGRAVGVHLMASTELILLLTLVLLLISDLNRPRAGTILAPMGPMFDVQSQLRAARTSVTPVAPPETPAR
jgi:hypothetical protein